MLLDFFVINVDDVRIDLYFNQKRQPKNAINASVLVLLFLFWLVLFCFVLLFKGSSRGSWVDRSPFDRWRNYCWCLRVHVTNFQPGRAIAKKRKIWKKIHKVALGELFLKTYILPRSDKYFGRTEINLVFQLSDPILGVWYRTRLRPPLKIKRPFLRNSK